MLREEVRSSSQVILQFLVRSFDYSLHHKLRLTLCQCTARLWGNQIISSGRWSCAYHFLRRFRTRNNGECVRQLLFLRVTTSKQILPMWFRDKQVLAFQFPHLHPSTPVFFLKTSLAIMVLSTAQLNAASPGGMMTYMYVFSVNRARKQLNLGVCTLNRRNPALAAVVLVFLATVCL